MNLEIPSDVLEWVVEVISIATDIYRTESDRIIEMREILSKKFGTILVVEYGRNGYKCDGVLTAKVNNILTAYIGILEAKNELGLGGCDPSYQGALYYQGYWSQSSVRLIFNPLISLVQIHMLNTFYSG